MNMLKQAPATIVEDIRLMRGHTRARLCGCDDGHRYVVKFMNNRFGPRVLINEWIAHAALNGIGLPVPRLRLVQCAGVTCSRIPPELHLGSGYIGDPMYDFLPDSLLMAVQNPEVFAGIFAFDAWVGNAAARQIIFTRAARGFRACIIDNSHVFGGPRWTFECYAGVGLWLDTTAQHRMLLSQDIEPWIERIQAWARSSVLSGLIGSLPGAWLLADDDMRLQSVGQALVERAGVLRSLINSRMKAVYTRGTVRRNVPSTAHFM